MSQIFEPFLNMTQWKKKIHMIQIFEPYFKIDSQNWIFKSYFNIGFFFKKKTQRIERIEPFLDITLRIELFFVLKIWLKELNFFLLNLDSKNCSFLFSWLQYLDLFSHDSNNWTFFFYVTQILDFFWKFLISKKWTFFFSGLKVFSSRKNNSQNCFFLNPTHRIKFILWIEPLNFLNMTQKNVTV